CDRASRARRARYAGAGAATDQVRAAARARGDVGVLVRARRRARRARERARVALVRRRARGALLTGDALAGLADHAGATRRPVRLVGGLRAHADAGRADERGDLARVRRRAGGTSGARRTRAVVAHHAGAADDAVRGISGVHARLAGGRADRQSDVARVAGLTGAAGRAAHAASAATADGAARSDG